MTDRELKEKWAKWTKIVTDDNGKLELAKRLERAHEEAIDMPSGSKDGRIKPLFDAMDKWIKEQRAK
jgi:hypothetical protein